MVIVNSEREQMKTARDGVDIYKDKWKYYNNSYLMSWKQMKKNLAFNDEKALFFPSTLSSPSCEAYSLQSHTSSQTRTHAHTQTHSHTPLQRDRFAVWETHILWCYAHTHKTASLLISLCLCAYMLNITHDPDFAHISLPLPI